MKFGLNLRKKITGADLYLRIFQFSAILPVIYIAVLSGYPALITKKSVFSLLFDCGLSLLPRWESLAISKIYQSSLSEVLCIFIPLLLALITGIIGNHLLKKNVKSAAVIHYFFIVMIAIDLVLRCLPFRFNASLGFWMWLFSFLLRLACLFFIILDLIAYKKEQKNTL